MNTRRIFFRVWTCLLLILFMHGHVLAEDLKASLLKDIAKKKNKDSIILKLRMKSNGELIVRFEQGFDDYFIAHPVRFEKGHYLNLDENLKINYNAIESYSFVLRHNYRKFAVSIVLGGMIIFTLVFLSQTVGTGIPLGPG